MKSSFAGFHPGIQQEYLEISMEKGKRLITQHASLLSIHNHCSDLAQGFYKMLCEKKFTRGRRTPLVGNLHSEVFGLSVCSFEPTMFQRLAVCT